MSSVFRTLLVVSCLASSVYSWGKTGHQLTGSIAEQLIAPATREIVKELIPDMAAGLSAASVWADSAKFTKGFSWSRTYHYAGGTVGKPHGCGFNQDRDCAQGKCITGAIGNYTTRLSCKYSREERGIALKFLTHFVGDETQPLHLCERMRGGNEAKGILFDGSDKYKKPGDLNLHGIWDSNIIEKRVKLVYGKSQARAVDAYVTKIKSAEFASQVEDWTACLRAPRSTPLECAIAWATESNAINCQAVWKAYDDNPKQDFGKAYYEVAYPIVEEQIMKGGVRIAALLDANLKSCRKEEE